MRLDHLLSKESTARAFGYSSRISGSSYVEHRLVGPSTTPTPRRSRAHVAPPGPAGSGHHCSVLREARASPAVQAGVSASPGQRGTELEELREPLPEACARRSSAARVLTRWLRTAERARASRTKNSQATKSQRWMPWRQMPMKDVGGCEKPRGAVYQALIRGYPNGETRLGSCPVTPA